jgi:hypothetical protein
MERYIWSEERRTIDHSASAVFAPWTTRSRVRIPFEAWMYTFLLSLSLSSCVGSDLAAGWSPVWVLYRLHLQGQKISRKQEISVNLLSRWAPARLIFRPWKWKRYVPSKRRLTLNGLHGVISQTMVLFITTAVRTSNLKIIDPNYSGCSTIRDYPKFSWTPLTM